MLLQQNFGRKRSMSLHHVILGLLNREPLTGYEIKKIVQNTPFMHWSGNNNQIYKAFAELLDEGLVAKEVQHQEGSPSKNIYTITAAGQNELKNWLVSVTDEPVFKKQILIKLALADRLTRGELENLLASYAEAVQMQAAMAERELEKGYFAEQVPSGKTLFLDLIRENIRSFYSGEQQWIEKVKAFIAELTEEGSTASGTAVQKEKIEEGSAMTYQLMESNGEKYLYITSSDPLIQREQDAVDIISLCVEHDTNAVVLEGNRFSDDFVRLRTGLAGTVLQKLGNYQIKAAAVIEGEHQFPVRFREMVSEHRAGNTFRIFADAEKALDWLLAARGK